MANKKRKENSLTSFLQNTAKNTILLEVLGIVSGLLYTILYIKEVKICFLFAIIGAIIYSILCIKKKVYAEVALQLFYIPMAIYGWIHWGEYHTNSFSFSTHLVLLFATLLAVLGTGYSLKTKTDSQSPYLDSFTTMASFTATWLMVNFVQEMWLYFIGVNLVSIWLYFQRGMRLSIFLFAFYTYISIAMWLEWELFF